MLLHQISGAIKSARLLIADQHQQHIPGRHNPFGLGPKESLQQHYYPALHIQGAPAPNISVDELTLEGGMLPFLGGGSHHIQVSVEQKRRRFALPGKPGEKCSGDLEIWPVRWAQSRPGSAGSNISGAGGFVARWIGRVEPDQLLESQCEV